MKKQADRYPKYYLVDFDIFVNVYKKGNEVVGVNSYGNPYPVFKAMAEGSVITEAEYLNKDSSRFDPNQ